MKKIFAVCALSVLTACGQHSEAQSGQVSVTESCKPAANARGKIVLAREKFGILERGAGHFRRIYDVQVMARDIGTLLEQSCVDASALDKTGTATATEMTAKLSEAIHATEDRLKAVTLVSLQR